jgi:uncharacterized protein (TIGR02391 family)
MSETEIRKIAIGVFTMFKNRTDGTNRDIDDIHPKNIHHFYFEERGISFENVVEAFEYLRLRNLIMPSIEQPYGFYMLTSVGRRTNPEDISEKFVDAHLLNELSQSLDKELARHCLGKSYEDAITSAFRILEERIREKIQAGPELFGVQLMEVAFRAERGKLYFGETINERQALFQLYRSAFMFLRNPPSHRFVEWFTDFEILEIILLTDLLLKILNKCELRS